MLTVIVAVVVLLGLGIAGTVLARRRAARVAQPSGAAGVAQPSATPPPRDLSPPRNVTPTSLPPDVIANRGATPRHQSGSHATDRAAEPVDTPRRDDVRFTVYRPASVVPEQWHDLLVFAHRAEGPTEGGGFQADLSETVHRAAQTLLGERAPVYRTATEDASHPVVRDSELAFVPEIDGVQFNPPRITLLWAEPLHRAEFRLKASAAMEGTTARGQLTIFSGPIVLAQMTLLIRVSATEEPADAVTQTISPYRRVFASYAHTDTGVVQQVREYARAIGDEYLIDVADLRAGELWEPRLEQLIRQADVFQLFWSSNAMHSRYVQQEYRYALSLGRAHFIRPVYWEDPLPSAPNEDLPPQALRAVHFQRIGVGGTGTTPTAVTPIPEPRAAGELRDIPATQPPRTSRRRALSTAALLLVMVSVFALDREAGSGLGGDVVDSTAPSGVGVKLPDTMLIAPPPVKSVPPEMSTRPERPLIMLGAFNAPPGDARLAGFSATLRARSSEASQHLGFVLSPAGTDATEHARASGIDEVATARVRDSADVIIVALRLTDVRRGRAQDAPPLVVPRDASAASIAQQVVKALVRMHDAWR